MANSRARFRTLIAWVARVDEWSDVDGSAHFVAYLDEHGHHRRTNTRVWINPDDAHAAKLGPGSLVHGKLYQIFHTAKGQLTPEFEIDHAETQITTTFEWDRNPNEKP